MDTFAVTSSQLPPVSVTDAVVLWHSFLDSLSDPLLMLDPQGRPRAELFLADSLHLNAQGYALWKTVIADHLRAPAPRR